jgi:hypothetical protein
MGPTLKFFQIFYVCTEIWHGYSVHILHAPKFDMDSLFHVKIQDSSDNNSIEGNENIDNDMSKMNIDANVDDLKYYVGTSYILES